MELSGKKNSTGRSMFPLEPRHFEVEVLERLEVLSGVTWVSNNSSANLGDHLGKTWSGPSIGRQHAPRADLAR